MSHSLADRLLSWALRVAAGIAASVIVLVVAFLVRESLPALRHVAAGQWFADASWHPTAGRFNLTPMVLATALTTLGAMLVVIPLGLASALFSRFYAPAPVAGAYRRILELLAGIPSVVYGFWGLVTLAPLIGRLHPPGQSALAGVLILSLMTLPTMALVTDAGFANAPPELELGGYALGVTRWGVVTGVALPRARSAVFTGAVLAAARAIGETMAVLMVCGNIVQVPHSVFDPVRTLTANIALEMAYAMGDHRSALFVSGLLLMVMVCALVLFADRLRARGVERTDDG